MSEALITKLRQHHSAMKRMLHQLEMSAGRSQEEFLDYLEEFKEFLLTDAKEHFALEESGVYPLLVKQEVAPASTIIQFYTEHHLLNQIYCNFVYLPRGMGPHPLLASYVAELEKNLLPHIAKEEELFAALQDAVSQTKGN